MNAILFPGQGSQIVGMGSEFYNNFEIVKNIFKEADDKLNYKISKNYFRRPRGSIKINSKYATSHINCKLCNFLSFKGRV